MIFRTILGSPVGRAALLAAPMLTFLSACAVGPDFNRPPPVESQHYDRQAEQQLGDRTRATGAQSTAPAQGDWWSAFRSPKLDRVMIGAIDGNFDLAAADATIAQANELVAAARGGLSPQVDAGGEAGRQRAGGHASNRYSVGPTASFDFDMFGGTRRLVEQRGALADLQRFRFEAAYLTLTGDVASQALLLASARAQIDAVQTLLRDDRHTLDLVRVGHQHGDASRIDVALATTQLEQDQTLLPPLELQRDVARHALSVLAGKGPADWIAPDFDLTDFALPTYAVSLPSELAHERPDILAAEAQLHAASAAIGIATADLYPHLQLSASLSEAGPGVGMLWSAVAGLAGPIFHGGSLKANRRAAIDGYNATLASYQQTVVRSLGQVADLLQAMNHDADQDAAQDRALSATQDSLRLNQAGYRAGEIDLLQVLDAERAYQRALLGRIRAKTARYLDAVQLAVALGGNPNGAFSRKPEPTKPPIKDHSHAFR